MIFTCIGLRVLLIGQFYVQHARASKKPDETRYFKKFKINISTRRILCLPKGDKITNMYISFPLRKYHFHMSKYQFQSKFVEVEKKIVKVEYKFVEVELKFVEVELKFVEVELKFVEVE